MPNWIKRREDELLAEGKTMALQVLDHLKEMLRDRGFDPYVDVNEMGQPERGRRYLLLFGA
jgi:hypothetical protein